MIEQYEFLSNLCEQIRGVSYKPFECSSIPKENYFPIYRAHNIQNDGLNDNDLVYVLQDKIADYQYIKKGDIVICASSGSKDLVGKAAQSEIDCNYSFGAFCKVIRPHKNINSKYLGFYFKSSEYRSYISSISKGSNINNLRNEDFDSIKIPFPPLEEQERIVKIIEKKITAVEKAKKASEEQLFSLYQLIYAYFSKTFDNNYGKYLLSNLTLPIENISSKDNGFIEYIDISSIDNINKKIISTHTISIDNAPSRAKQITINNDILVSTVRPNLNAVAINDIESKNTIVCSTGYCVLRCNDKIDYKYLFYFCLSKYFIDYLTNLAKGSSYPAVVDDDVLSCFIPLPSINEQCEIVKILDYKYNLYKKLRNIFTKQSEYLNALPPSILRKAFNGDY